MRFSQLGRFVALVFFSALFFILLAPGCGRSSLEPETLDGGGNVRPCGPSTCPNGCCDASGQCRTGNDTRACGSVGNRCSDCVANGFSVCTRSRVCGRDDPSCSPATCPGCCGFEEGRMRCLSGTEASACGRRGSSCNDCSAQGRACDSTTGSCSVGSCNPSNCEGCCVGDKCLLGVDVVTCGNGGRACTTCLPGQSCQPENGGGQCVGIPSCGPENCGGCCNQFGQCVIGTDHDACGKGGDKCSACGNEEQCVPDGQPGERTCRATPRCGPDNCAGCCAPGDQCVIATTPAACGRNGQACVACAPGNTCEAGQCKPAAGCNAATCPGCCLGDICALGNQNTACGLGGLACQNCAGQVPTKVCQGGTCEQPLCGPGNCAGCCSGNTCVVGTQDNACGPANGRACRDCTAANQICQGRACVDKCGPTNCSGCCGPGNACQPGFQNTACGAAGAVCENCDLAGSFCNGLVNPRQCNNHQTTCPAPYTTCPGGTTIPVTPAVQNLCNATQLNNVGVACAGGPNSIACIAAMQVLAISAPACASCLNPFNVPFDDHTGLYRCAAPSLDAACRGSVGCAVDCLDKSCTQCLPATRPQCRALVSNPGQQCRTFTTGASCADTALAAGQFCSQFSYTDFGQWLSAIGDHFCGNGP